MFCRSFIYRLSFPLAYPAVDRLVDVTITDDTSCFAIKTHDFRTFATCNAAFIRFEHANGIYIPGKIRIGKCLPSETGKGKPALMNAARGTLKTVLSQPAQSGCNNRSIRRCLTDLTAQTQ